MRHRHLALLLAEEGHTVDALDFSPAMVELAAEKLAGSRATVRLGDAAEPGLEPSSADVVLCRHVLWALADPVAVVRRWVQALGPGGRLVLVEGSWVTGAGLTAERCAALVGEACSRVEVRHLPTPPSGAGPSPTSATSSSPTPDPRVAAPPVGG